MHLARRRNSRLLSPYANDNCYETTHPISLSLYTSFTSTLTFPRFGWSLVQRLGRAKPREPKGKHMEHRAGQRARSQCIMKRGVGERERKEEGKKVEENKEERERERPVTARAASRSVGPLDSLPIGPRIDSRNWPPKNVRYCTMQMHGARIRPGKIKRRRTTPSTMTRS